MGLDKCVTSTPTKAWRLPATPRRFPPAPCTPSLIKATAFSNPKMLGLPMDGIIQRTHSFLSLPRGVVGEARQPPGGPPGISEAFPRREEAGHGCPLSIPAPRLVLEKGPRPGSPPIQKKTPPVAQKRWPKNPPGRASVCLPSSEAQTLRRPPGPLAVGTPGPMVPSTCQQERGARPWPAHPPASLLSICPPPWVVYSEPASLRGFKALALGTSTAGSRPRGNWRRGGAQRPALTHCPPPAVAFELLQTDLPGLQGHPTGNSNKLLVPREIY